MTLLATANTVWRVLTQVWHDRRTLQVLLLVPSGLLTILKFTFTGRPDIFNEVGLMLLGIFPFVSMFLVTSVAMVRERTSGTLERLLSTPVGKLDVLFGYGIAFGLLAICQAGIAAVVSYTLLGLRSQGSQSIVLLIAASTAVLGAAIGLLTSAFAQTEFQALQFMPVVVLPQVLLCGLVWPREEMSGFLQVASNFMPLRYAAEALREVETYPDPTTLMWRDLVVIVICAILVLVGAAATLRRQTD